MNLCEFCDRDKIWEKHKANSDRIAQYYANSQFEDYCQRIIDCGNFLKFEVVSGEIKLLNAKFCRIRYCPVCQWRRSLQWKARAYKTIPTVVNDFPRDRWLFLTLTVKNCPVKCLRKTLNEMHLSFKRLTKLKEWRARGWIKSTEVTLGHDGLAHPHFHCLLMVPASYFSGSYYLSHAKWVQLWQRSLKIDYLPVVDLKAIKKADNPTVLIPEILKYQTKVKDLISDREWLIELTRQLHKTRSIAIGGVLKSYLRQLEEQFEELPEEDEIENCDRETIYFSWNPHQKIYQKSDNLDY
ncbi:protein rep [Candidatus Gracilibacteria bacterium]|nr:protein rep [Candidatus Gracilibacteria bacterium]NJM89890.1 protein rep [Hydrococcus sp. RU_2_2]NJQ98450.1 protein rep [Hydrococcus sp. CSU_1_8]